MEVLMFRAKKLDKLVQAGIISVEQKQQILDFDKDRNTGFVGKLLSLLGVFIIGCGVISVIAANWKDISDSFKLFVMFALLFGGGYMAYMWQNNGMQSRAEKMLLGLFLLSGAAIGLIIQIYQLSGGQWYSVLAVWFLVTAPLLFVAKDKYLFCFWVPVFLVWCDACLWDAMHDRVLYGYITYKYGEDKLAAIALFGVFVFLAKMIMLYVSRFKLGEVLHKYALFAAYLEFACYILFSWSWKGGDSVQFIRLLIALGLIIGTSIIYKHYGSYDLIRRNIKFAGLVVFVFYADVASSLGLLESGIGLILSGAGLLVLVKLWPWIVNTVIGEKKNV